MTLKTIKEQAATDLLSAQYDTGNLGVESATYTPPGGSGSDVTARLRYGAGADDTVGADTLGGQAVCLIQVSDVATVETGATLVIGSATWEVLYAELTPAGLEWVCDVAKQ